MIVVVAVVVVVVVVDVVDVVVVGVKVEVFLSGFVILGEDVVDTDVAGESGAVEHVMIVLGPLMDGVVDVDVVREQCTKDGGFSGQVAATESGNESGQVQDVAWGEGEGEGGGARVDGLDVDGQDGLEGGCGGCDHGDGGNQTLLVGHLDSFHVGPSSGSGCGCARAWQWQRLGHGRVLWEVRS